MLIARSEFADRGPLTPPSPRKKERGEGAYGPRLAEAPYRITAGP